MELPVINPASATNPETILRALKKSAAELCSQSTDVTELVGSTAYHSSDFQNIYDANLVYDLHQPVDAVATEIIAEIDAHFLAVDLQCYQWIPSGFDLEPELIAALTNQGCQRSATLAMMLAAGDVQQKKAVSRRDDLQIIPARALAGAYRDLHVASHTVDWNAQSAENMATFKLHGLDDPRLDMFIVRIQKQVVASAGIYALGEIGVVHEINTHPDYRRQGIMRGFMAYLLDHAARSQFKAVALETAPANEPAISLYESLGFKKLVEYPTYKRIPVAQQND